MEQSAQSPVKQLQTSITVTRADGTVQEYGVVDDSSWGVHQRLQAALRTRKLNREAGHRTPLLQLIRHVFYGGN